MARIAANPQIHADSLESYLLAKRQGFAIGVFLSVFFLLIAWSQGFAQGKIKARSKQLYDSANRLLPFDPTQALIRFKEAIKIDSLFAAPYMRVGQILSKDEISREDALKFYQKAVALDSNEIAFLPIYKILGLHFLHRGDYQNAKKYFRGVTQLNIDKKNIAYKSAIRYLSQCEFAANQHRNRKSYFELHPLPSPLNLAISQSYPVLTADLETLIFTNNSPDEDLYVSYFSANGWSKPQSLSPEINTNFNEGTCTVSADGSMLIFTACKRRENYGKCDLYSSQKVRELWQRPQNLGSLINSNSWQSQPSLSADGRTLYFSSDRNGGFGGKDIWKTTLNSLGWCMPVNLGKEINTEFDEVSPFIHANGISLFFASDGRPGMGGLDIFLSRKDNENWSSPVNLGGPLNDFADQVGFAITPDCQRAFYSYNNKSIDPYQNGNKLTVLCDYDLPDSLKKLCPPALVLKGTIADAQNQRPLSATLDLNFNNTKSSTFTSERLTGHFLVVLPTHLNSTLRIKKEGYYPTILNITDSLLKQNAGERINIELLPLITTRSEILKSVSFKQNESTLDSISYNELNVLIKYLNEHPSLKLVIEGHTDDVGDNDANMKLSLKRAEAVVEYLVKSAISPERLTAKGYGKTRPLVKTALLEFRQKNRRVEWRILE